MLDIDPFFTDGDDAPRPRGWLVAIAGRHANEALPIFEGTNVFGRSLENQIVLTDPTVARRHGRIECIVSEARADRVMPAPVTGVFRREHHHGRPIATGDPIDERTIVGAIEALGETHPVAAGARGTFLEHLIEDGVQVKFGSGLYRVAIEDAAAFELVDHNTANGCFVNGRRVSESVMLADGDDIFIGGVPFRFERA